MQYIFGRAEKINTWKMRQRNICTEYDDT